MIRNGLVFGGLVLATALGIGCGNSGSGGGNVLMVNGGLGGANGGSGGDGGDFDVEINYGTGGNIVVSSSGRADAGFSASSFVPYLGANPLTISADTTIEQTPAAAPAVGVAYIDTDMNVYVSDGDANFGSVDADEVPVTGILVDGGVTLTFGVPMDADVDFNLYADFVNEGTVTTADQSPTARGDLTMTVGSFINRGTVTLAAVLPGQDGGDLYVDADAASAINHGTIDTSGGDADNADAGDGGNLTLYGEHFVETTGPLYSHGGSVTAGATGMGGDAGDIYLEADLWGDIRSSGDVDASGGDGVLGGGDAGYYYTYIEYTGDCVVSGSLDLSGGDASAGDGGDGSYYECETWQGGAYVDVDLNARGGSTTDPAGSGGDGGDFYIFLYEGSSDEPTPGDYSPNKDIEVSGSIDLRGGDAVATGSGDGGDAGEVEIDLGGGYWPMGQEIRLLGFAGLDISGGDGNTGGDAGDFDFWQEYGYDEDQYYAPGGFVVEGVDFMATGGDVVAGAMVTPAYGGAGGDVDFDMTTYPYSSATTFAQAPPELDFRGDIDTSGGESLEGVSTGNANGGDVYVYAKAGVRIRGSIDASGGSDAGATAGAGSDGGDVSLMADYGDVRVTGSIDMRGGDAAMLGGEGGGSGDPALGTSQGDVSSGDILADGGNADAALGGSVGGDAGAFWLFSPDGVQGTSHGNLSALGGTGQTPGEDGEIIAGGHLITP